MRVFVFLGYCASAAVVANDEVEAARLLAESKHHTDLSGYPNYELYESYPVDEAAVVLDHVE